MAARYVTALLTAFDRYADRPALAFHGDELSFGQLRDVVYRIARTLLAHGVTRGAGITCITANRPEVLMTRLAAHVLGARFTCVVVDSATHGLEHVLGDSDPTVVIADRPLPIPPGLPARVVPLDELVTTAATRSPAPVPVAALEDDIARVTYTSGTTGLPKGVVSSFSAMRARTGRGHTDGAEPTFVSVTSLAQRAGGRCLEQLLAGCRVEILADFSPEKLMAACARHAPAATYLMPHQIYRLLDHPATGDGIPGLVAISYGASAIAPSRLREAMTRLGVEEFRQGYGMNETAVITRLSPQDHRVALGQRPELLASAGRAVAGVTIEIRDEGGTPAPTGKVGEVCVRSPAMMSGYWRRPDLTAEVLRGGWLHTGDLGRLDDEGYLYLVDRLSDMIVIEGDNCYTAPIEAALVRHPAIAAAAVVGHAYRPGEEEIHAFCVPSPGHAATRVTAAQACDQVVEELAPLHRPSRVHWVSALPLVATGKPDKKRLRASIGGSGSAVHR